MLWESKDEKEEEILKEVVDALGRTSKKIIKIRKPLINILKSNYVKSERPDFIFSYDDKKIGVEHFKIDISFKDENSCSDRSKGKAKELFRSYWKKNCSVPTEKEKREFVQKVNDFSCIPYENLKNWNYINFIQETERIVNKHKTNIEKYKEKCEKILFLVELYYYPVKFKNFKNNVSTISSKPAITKDFIEILSQDSIDYFIVALNNGQKIDVLFTNLDQKDNIYDEFDLFSRPNIEITLKEEG